MAPSGRSTPLRNAPRSSRRRPRWLGVLAILIVMAAGGADKPPSKPVKNPKPAPRPAKKPEKPSVLGLDQLGLPAHAIVVVCEGLDKALGLIPKAVVLTPQEYKKLTDRIAELERKLRPGRPLRPSTCKLRVLGSLDGDSARLEAEFKFKAEGKSTRIGLGCRGASPRKPELDGKEVLLENDDDGFVVVVDPDDQSHDDHVLTMELSVPIGPRGLGLLGGGSDSGLELSLPRAAVTTVQVEQMPAGAAEIRCNGGVIRGAEKALALGPVDRLTLVWKKPAVLPGVGPLITADGQITVRVDERLVTTEANLLLRDERGQTKDWVVTTPPQTTVEVIPADERDGRAPPCTVSSDKPKSQHTIHLEKPTAEPLRVLLRVSQARPKGRVPIGPFALLNGRQPGAIVRHQQGSLVIRGLPVGVSWREPHDPAVTREEQTVTDAQRRDKVLASFRYFLAGNLPPRPGPVLTLDVREVPGMVETQVRHTLRLERTDQGWQVQALTTLAVQPRRAAVEALDIQLPRAWPDFLLPLACLPRPGLPVNLVLASPCLAGAAETGPSLWPFTARYRLDRNASLANGVERIDPVDPGRRVRVILAEKKSTPFTLALRGVYRLAPGVGRVRLELPRPWHTLDRGGEVEIVVPADQELVASGANQPPLAPGTHRNTFAAATAPDRLEFAWRPYRPELAVALEADVFCRHRQAWVVERVRFPTTRRLPADVLFKVIQAPSPDVRALQMLGNNLRVTGGKICDAGRGEDGAWPVALSLGKDGLLKLEYVFPLPESGVAMVPLLWPVEATRTESKVRVWAGPDRAPAGVAAAAGSSWREGKTELVPGRAGLPALVLHGSGRAMPLVLHLTNRPPVPLAAALVDRALIVARVVGTGGATYRARFRISRFNSPVLVMEFPAAPTRLAIRLDDRLLSARRQPPDKDDGKTASAATSYRVDIDPDLYPRPAILDVLYELGPAGGEAAGPSGVFDHFRETLSPPSLRAAIFLGRVRWLVELPAGQMVLHTGGGAASEYEWGLKGWLLGPRPTADRAELERWLAGSDAAGGGGESEPSLVCRQPSPAPLPLVHVPQKAWLLACSLLCLAVGLALTFVPWARGRVAVYAAVGLLGLAACAAGLFWPDVVPAVLFGCEPGVAVLVLVLAVHWTLQRRYRRQLVFMPGFTRLKTGSSLIRGGSRPREPSTVDGQPAPDSAAPKLTS